MPSPDPEPTPLACGCRWPAEWEPHAATWLAWPHNRATWPGRFDRIPTVFAHLIRTLARFEPVQVLAGGPAVLAEAREMVGQLPNVTLHDIPTNDAWTRDYGPMFLLDAEGAATACVDWDFNCWGGKYPPWDHDAAVAGTISHRLGLRRFRPHVVLEGGSVDGNGQGTILTTESCLLDPQRNPGVTRQSAEFHVQQFASAREVIWLRGGPLAGDDTDGHIDQLARFVAPRQVLVAVADDPDDENHGPLGAERQRLEAYRDPGGRSLEVVPLPIPSPIVYDGQRTPASYCNFYLVNGGVVMPEFADPADARARAILQAAFPDREVVGIPARELIWGLGAIHCLTQQQPAGRA